MKRVPIYMPKHVDTVGEHLAYSDQRIYFSAWRIISLQAFMLTLAIIPFVTDPPQAIRFAVYRTIPGKIILASACIYLGIMTLMISVLLLAVVRNLPAVELSENYITIFSFPRRSVKISDIEEVMPPENGLAKILVRGEKPLIIPAWAYKGGFSAWRNMVAMMNIEKRI